MPGSFRGRIEEYLIFPALSSVCHIKTRMRKISQEFCTHPNCFRIPGIISAS